MKILTVIATMGAGGAEALVAALAAEAAARGDRPCVASAGGWRADRLGAAGVALLDLPLVGRNPLALRRAAARLRRQIADGRPDLIHAHNVKASAVAALARHGRGIPILTTLHGLARYRAAARILELACDRVVAVSDHVAGRLRAAGYPAARLQVIENAITPPAAHRHQLARLRLGVADGAPVAVCIARLARQKRHDLLIEAWRRVRPDAVLVLVGDGPTRGAIERSVAAGALAGRVRLLGERDDVDWLLAAADLAVLPTDWEGLPVSLLEAMAAGVPVVASRVGGVAETLGGAAQLVEPGSSRALAAGLDALLDDPQRRAELAARGRALVAARFDPQRMSRAYRRLYGELCRTDVGSMT